MKLRKKIIAVILCMGMVIGAMHVGNIENQTELESIFEPNSSLIVWYTDEAMTDYINALAVAFHEQGNVRVLPKLQSGSDYLESIYDASMHDEEAPDLYIVSNEVLEKAYLSGIAAQVKDNGEVVNEQNFPEAALNAVTYHDQIIGYPYYFETSALLYNETYLTEMATNQILSENSDENPDEEEAEKKEQANTEVDADALTEHVEKSIPTTFDELLTFADEYDAPAAVEAVFKWDVNDIFYNYFFIGNYMDIGGKNGDHTDEIDLYNADAIAAMKVYQNLNQFFSIDATDVAYDSVIQEFMEGKLVFTTATTDIMKKLDAAKQNGEFAFDYGLAPIPDLNEELSSRSLSVTNTMVVNGYSTNQENANKFAKFAVCDNADTLYDKVGKIPSTLKYETDNASVSVFQQEYAGSAPLPKMMATSNYWVQLEIAFADVWNGAKVTDRLKKFDELIMTQVTGEPYEAEYIKEQEQEETITYLDEEAEKEAAKQEDN